MDWYVFTRTGTRCGAKCLGLALLISIMVGPVISQSETGSSVVVEDSIAVYDLGVELSSIEWNPNGDVLAAATDDGIRIFDHLLQPITSVHPGDAIYGVSWSPDGSQLAVTHNSQLEVWQWNPEAASLVLTDEVQGNGLQVGVLWSPDGQRIVSMEAVDLGGVWYGTYHFWTADPVQSTGLAQGLYYFFNPPNSSFMGWAPDGQPVLMGFGYYVREEAGGPVFDSPRQYYLIDAGTGQRLREVTTGQLSMSASWRPPSGDLLAIGSETGVDLFDIASGQPISNLDAFYDPRSLDWSPDGRYLAGSSLVADSMTGEVVGRFGSNISQVTALDWHPSGLWLAVVEDNARLTIEDAMQWPDFVPPVLPTATSTTFHTDTPTPEPTATSTPTDTPTFACHNLTPRPVPAPAAPAAGVQQPLDISFWRLDLIPAEPISL
jgi:WD40 repeat protein